MRARWFSARSLGLHVALVAWVAICSAAAWWQIGRAFQGNEYSYLYAVEWPVFAVAGVFGWWALLHTEPPTPEAREARRQKEVRLLAQAIETKRDRSNEDDELAAYNDHLAELAESGKRKTWRH